MAEQSDRDVVNQALSVDGQSSIDVSGPSHATTDASEVEAGLDAAGVKSTSTPAATSIPHSDPGVPEVIQVELPSLDHKELEASILTLASDVVTEAPHAGDGREQLMNGDSGSYDDAEEAGYQHSTGGETNPSSDTDPAKSEGLEQATDADSRQETSGPAKKTLFKAVSVTKNFLAKTAAGTLPTAKPTNEKGPVPAQTPSTAPQAAPKPRLVAKLGSGARPGTFATGTGSSGGPDASKVWNRNRPVPAPAPKQFTDEELKQQYGIHLATRLGPEEGSKESKWADIDDDEDDWAPQTVEWMDGTKSTIAPTDAQLGVPGSAAMVAKALDNAQKDPSAPVQRLSTISSAGKTILRPGARLVTQSTKPGLVLRSVPDSSAQIEKPSTPVAARSPWAPLPPVDRASPVSFNPPLIPRNASPSALVEPSASEVVVSTNQPAREIGPDDFNRSWRDGEKSSRELFNSQSGRYEPVKASQRPPRQESGRPPSLLQRPSHHGGGGSAEPSAAFQSRTGSGAQDGSSWSRRRDSMSTGDRNASQGRLSVLTDDTPAASPVQNLKRLDRDSHETPPSNTLQFQNLPESQQSSTNAPISPTVTQSYFPSNAAKFVETSASATPAQDPRLVQQQLMREKIELNRKRKQEEEAKEEAARKERIRIKLEAMGAAASAQTTSVPGTSPSVTQLSNAPPSQPHFTETAEPKETAPKPVSDGLPAAHTPRVASIEPAKAGNSSASTKTSPASRPSKSPRSQHIGISSPQSGAPRPLKSLSDSNLSTSDLNEIHQLPGLGEAPPDDQGTQPWGALSGSPSAGWGGGNRSANVWGPVSTDRPLGNGAFESIPKQRQAQAASQHAKSSPLAPRPPTISPGISFDSGLPDPAQPFAQPQLEGMQQGQQWYQATPHNISPYPQHPPASHIPDQPFRPPPLEQAQTAKRAWREFPSVATRHDADARDALLAQRGPADDGFEPTFRETFRQTKAGDTLGNRQVVSVSKITHEGRSESAEGAQTSLPQPIAPPVPQISAQHPTSVPGLGRSSRFFGPTVERSPPIPNTIFSAFDNDLAELELSQPPPDSTDHPVFGGRGHPTVHLPAPPPKVKLPPASTSTSAADGQRAAFLAPQMPNEGQMMMPWQRVGSQPLVNQVAWQDRFNGLLRPHMSYPSAMSSPETSSVTVHSALAVETSSKAALDVSAMPDAATVSLPQKSEALGGKVSTAALPDHCIESKPSEEELVEEREFGSSPTVHLPRVPHGSPGILLTMPPQKFGSKYAQIEMGREFVSSVPPLSFEDLGLEQKVLNGMQILIRLLGRPLKTMILHENRIGSPSSRGPKPRKPKRIASGKLGTGVTSSPVTEENTRADPTPAGKSPRPGKFQKHGKGSPQVNGDTSTVPSGQPYSGPSQEPSGDARVARGPTTWAKPPKGRYNPRP